MGDKSQTTEAAWAQCPTPDACRASGQEHPCLACWDEAGDIVAGLRLEELMSDQSQTTDGTTTEPEIFITVQRWVGGHQVLTQRKFDYPTFMQARDPGGMIEVEINAMLKEVGRGR